MINIFLIVLLLITFWGVKAYGRSTSPDFFSLQQTKNIQGVACIAVILHHLVQQVSGYGVIDKGPITIFNDIGIFITAIFFFISGYGLMTSYLNKPDYLDKFLLRRLPTVLIPFWIINLLGVILNRFLYGPINSPLELFFDITGLTLINGNGWFIIEITILYVIFYILFRFIKKKDVALTLMIVAVLIIISFASHRGHDVGEAVHWFKGEWWYNSTITFAYGLIYARFKKQFDSFFFATYYFILPLFTFLAVGMAYVCRFATMRFGYYLDTVNKDYRRSIMITLIIQSVGCLIFVTFILLLNMRFTINNAVIRYLSSISMELFLIHGFFVHQIFGGLKMNDFFRFCLVFLWSIVFTAILSLATHYITRKFVMWATTPKEFNDTVEGKILSIQYKKRVKIYTISLISLFVAAILFVLIGFFRREVFANFEYNSEMKALANAQIGDEVYYGHYDLNYHIIGEERVPWIVIKKEGDSVCLLCKYGIAGSSFNQKPEAVNWETSDIRSLLNTDSAIRAFNKYERMNLDIRNDDVFTLLTNDEAREIFESDDKRLLELCQSASFNGVNESLIWRASQHGEVEFLTSWWWLRRADDEESTLAPFVTINGEIGEKEVNRPDGAIRPVIWVKLTAPNSEDSNESTESGN